MLDRYYTPSHVAAQLLYDCGFAQPTMCADTSCGSGSLLKAAADVYPHVRCAGADKDASAIRALRRENPRWILSVADILQAKSHSQAAVFRGKDECDLLLLNPPFSKGGLKAIEIEFSGKAVRASVALACVLSSLELMKPKQGVLAIVPESLLFSDVDETGRRLLLEHFSIERVRQLHSTTFSGARAHCWVIRLQHLSSPKSSDSRNAISAGSSSRSNKCPAIVRGGLPVFEARSVPRGIPFLHSTDLRKLARDATVQAELPLVRPINRGLISGHVILIPRVGVPSRESIRPIHLKSKVQMSDCVIALSFRTKQDAANYAAILLNKWDVVEGLYRGTGARYVTVERLCEGLPPISYG